jgi:sortase A
VSNRKIHKVIQLFTCCLASTMSGYPVTVWAGGNVYQSDGIEILNHSLPYFDPTNVDFSDWSDKRVQAWRKALDIRAPEAFAMLYIEDVNIAAPVFVGSDESSLDIGLGWVDYTDEPGMATGNTGIAGHRDSFFRNLRNIQKGNMIEVQTISGRFTYRVDKMSVVDIKEVSVLDPQDKEMLTLVTCYPFDYVGDAPQRYIVSASRQY